MHAVCIIFNVAAEPNANLFKVLEFCGLQTPVYHLFIIKTDNRDILKEYLKDNYIETGIHYPMSISELKCYDEIFDKNKYNNAIENSKKILSLPMYPNLKDSDIITICGLINNFT